MSLSYMKNIKSAAILFCWLPMTVSSDAQIDVLATAVNLKTSEMLYYEHHSYTEAGKHKIRYINMDSQSFDNKELSYYPAVFRPEVFQENQWSGEQIRVVYGADEELQYHGTELMADKTLELSYLTPTKEGATPQKLEKNPLNQSPLVRFQISAKHWLVTMILPPIMLTYEEYERLIRFDGTSNIEYAYNRYLDVDVKFEYVSPLNISRL